MQYTISDCLQGHRGQHPNHRAINVCADGNVRANGTRATTMACGGSATLLYTGHHETLLEKSRTHKCTSYWPFVTATSWFHGAKVPHLTCTQKLYVQVTTKPIFFFHCSFCCCRKAIVDVLYFGTLFFKASVGRYVFGRFQHRAKKTPFNLQKLTQSWIQQWCDAKSSKYYQYYQKLNHY